MRRWAWFFFQQISTHLTHIPQWWLAKNFHTHVTCSLLALLILILWATISQVSLKQRPTTDPSVPRTLKATIMDVMVNMNKHHLSQTCSCFWDRIEVVSSFIESAFFKFKYTDFPIEYLWFFLYYNLFSIT